MKTRSYALVGGAAAAALVLAACGNSDSGGAADGEDITLTYATYGGTFEAGQIEAWQEPYAAENPHVSFANTSPSDNSMIMAQVEANAVEWDIADTDPYFAANYCDEFVEPLELTDVDTEQYDDALIGECYFGAYQFALIISYNTNTWPEPETAPSTVEDFFDTDNFPGQRGVVNDVTNGLLEYGLLADGVAVEDLYPLDVDRSLSKWDTIKDDTTFAANNGEMLQLATGEQVDMMMLVSARTMASLDEGAPFEPIWDRTMVTFNTLVVPKGAPHADEAMRFIDFVLNPEPSARFAELAGVAPTNQDAEPDLSENGVRVNAFDPDVNPGDLITTNADWWGPNVIEVSDTYTTWLNR